MQFVEVELRDVVDGPAVDGEEQPGRPKPGAAAIGTRALHHDLVEPRLHLRTALAALAVAAVVAFDAPGDPVEADVLAFPVVSPDAGLRWRRQPDLPRVDAVQDRVPRAVRQLVPRHVEREAEGRREAVHHAAVPGVRVVAERFANEAAAANATLRVGYQQFRVRELVDAEAAARPAGALRIVEHEVVGADVPVDEVMRGAAEPGVQAFRLGVAGAAGHVDLHQAVADEQRATDAGPDCLLVRAADDEAIHDRVDVVNGRFVHLHLG